MALKTFAIKHLNTLQLW